MDIEIFNNNYYLFEKGKNIYTFFRIITYDRTRTKKFNGYRNKPDPEPSFF